jgi:transcriptional regulator with XRE-family HTH domain
MANPKNYPKKTYANDTAFSVKLRSIMADRNINDKELAGKLYVVADVIGRWRRGTCEPSLESLAALCRELDVSADYMLGLTDNTEV